MSKKLLSLAVVAPIAFTLVGTAVPAQADTQKSTVPSSFTFNGAGWGHGVGMSQYGAYGMALEGYKAEQILEHYYNPAQLSNTRSYANSDIAVQLISGQSSTTITPNDGKMRVKIDGKTYTSSKGVGFAVSGKNIAVTVDGKKITTSKNANVGVEWENTRYWNSGNSNTTVTVPKANGGYGNGVYRHGKISVSLLKGKLNIVNSLRVNDEYLYGLAEVPSSWAQEALKAQAIAGRTYALRNMSSLKGACGCNVYDEVASQKFTGWIKENERNGIIGKRWVSAVDQTQTNRNGVTSSAQVMVYKGSLIDAVYSSSTGGKTRSAKDVWGNEHDYLQSRDDRWALDSRTGNPNRAWSGTVSQAVASKAYGLPDIKRIAVSKNSDGTIRSSTAYSTSGKSSTLSQSATRSLFKAKSKWVFGITGAGEQLPSTDSYKTESVKSGESFTTTANLNMRHGPNTSYSVVKTLPKGQKVVTTGKKSGSWVHVKAGSSDGWVSSAYLAKVSAPKPTPKPVPKPKPAPNPEISKPKPAPKPVITTKSYQVTANLHLRSGAGTQYKSLTVLKKNSKVTSTGKTSGRWYQVKSGNKTGWVSSTYLKATSTSGSSKPATPKPPKQTQSNSKTYTTTANLHLRAGASTSHKSLTVLKKNSKVVATGKTSGRWYQVKAGNKTGWVSSTYLKKTSTTAKNKVIKKSTTKKTTANLNLRTGAGTGHKILLTIPKNKSVTLTGKKSGSWAQVKYGSKTGWVSTSYIK